jgi:hypothetical protein
LVPAVRHASSDHRDSAEKIEPALAADPIEKMEATEATEPIERTDPAEPMDKIEPVEPMDRIDPLDPMLSSEPAEPADRSEVLTFPMLRFSHPGNHHRHRRLRQHVPRPGFHSASILLDTVTDRPES